MVGNHLRQYHNVIFKPDFEVPKMRKNVGLNTKNAFLKVVNHRVVIVLLIVSSVWCEPLYIMCDVTSKGRRLIFITRVMRAITVK